MWILLKLTYGIYEAGRQWDTIIEGWITDDIGMERVPYVRQLFVKRNDSGEIYVFLLRIADDLLFSGSNQDINFFLEQSRKRFEVGKANLDGNILFNG